MHLARWRSVLLASITLALVACATTTTVAADHVIRVGAYHNPPLISVEGDSVTGFAPDVFAEIAEREQWEIEYVTGTWPEMLDLLDRGDIDVLMAIAWTEDRAERYDFTGGALLLNWGVLALSETHPPITSIDELDGEVVAALRNDVYLTDEGSLSEVLDAAGVQVEIREFDTYDEVFEAVESGAADAGLANRLVVAESAREFGLRSSAAIVLDPISVRFAAPPTADATNQLLVRIDAQLSGMQLDPNSEYYRALERHMSGVLPANRSVPDWVVYVAIAVGALVVGLSASVLFMRMTIRRQTEQVRTTAERLRSLFDALPDAVFVLSPDGTIVDFKPAESWDPAIPPETFLGQNLVELPLPDRVIETLGGILEAVVSGAVRQTGTYWLRTPYPDGPERYYEARMSPTASGRDVLLVVRDATDEYAVQQAERSRADELEAAVAQRTRELAETNIELRAASQAKSTFLANMSHELRTPLNSVIGFSGTLLQGLAGELNAEQRRQLEMINTSGHHLLELVNDVLDLTRVESGGSEPVIATVDVRTALLEAAGSLESRARNKGIALEVEAGPCGDVRTDRRMLLQILLNLLNNAVKFTTVGSVTATCAQAADGATLITISDTGPGMAADEIPRAFEEFYQLPNEQHAKSGGFGLGLPISRRLAELIGARIEVESTPGVGTTFTVTLPPATAGHPGTESTADTAAADDE